MTEKKHLWIGVCIGRVVPMARLALAGMRVTRLDTFVAKNPEIVRYSCLSMETMVKKLHFPDGTTTSLMPATWVEFMGIGEEPNPATIAGDAGNDDYRIAFDLDTGDCYYRFRDPAEAKGAAWFLGQFVETVNQRKEYRLEFAS
ncbi:hypothetical protein [Bifidobacterium ruminantium]|uniref:hypothetical protein n=1 Tax=Bifidobacterium ruminantium TaxID=78346 RepID=UPI0024909CF1|nr:hypothetical protein [Bifidobacterium ruminantium]